MAFITLWAVCFADRFTESKKGLRPSLSVVHKKGRHSSFAGMVPGTTSFHE